MVYILEVNLSSQIVSTQEAFLISVTLTELLTNDEVQKRSGQVITSNDQNNTLIE